MLLLIDNYDSFTYNLYDYFGQLGATCEVVRNDSPDLDAAFSNNWAGVVLSPGPCTPNDAGRLMEAVGLFAGRVPLLGICLGHQAIAAYYGANIVRAPQPMHGKTSWVTHTQRGLFAGLPNPVEVMRYHSLVAQHLPPTLHITATATDDGSIMAFEHRSLPIAGVQFHPESVGTPEGLAMLSNWLRAIA